MVGHAINHFFCFAAGATPAGGHQPAAPWHSGREEGPLPPAAEDGLPGGAPVPGGVGGVARPGLHKRQLRPSATGVSGEDASPGGGQVPGGAGRCPRPSVTSQRHPGQQPGQVSNEPGPDILPRPDWLRRLVRKPSLLSSQTDASSDTKAWRLGPNPGGQATAAGAGKYFYFGNYFLVSMIAYTISLKRGVWGVGAMDPDDDDLSFDAAARERQVLGQAEMRVLFLHEKTGKSTIKLLKNLRNNSAG